MESDRLEDFRNLTLPDAQEIMAGWRGDATPVVSVVCMTYNHDLYLEDAIRGFLLQKTTFSFEIVFHDDLSTDSTRDIIDRYAERYPAVVKKVFQKENQFSKGKKILLLATWHARGEFIALCEGDDFWIDRDKLQSQVDGLERYPECEMCFHPAYVLKGEKLARKLFCRRARKERLFELSPIIRCGGSFMPTASMLIRRSFFDRASTDPSGFFKKYLMGYFCQVFCSLKGGALYIDRPMSVYRSLAEGSWTQSMARDPEFHKKWLKDYLTSLREADTRTDHRYSRDFFVPIRRRHLSVLNSTDLDLQFRRSYFTENRQEIGLSGTIMWFGFLRVPRLHKFALRVRLLFRKLRGQD